MLSKVLKAIAAAVVVALIYVTGDPSVVGGLSETVEGILAVLATFGIVYEVPNQGDPVG